MGERFGSGDGAVSLRATKTLSRTLRLPAKTEENKSAETGAYPDKEGRYRDVWDLLTSSEVKTMLHLQWGGAPERIFMGLAEVNNKNDAEWRHFVHYANHWLGLILFPLVVLTTAVILLLPGLPGLPNLPTPSAGIPDTVPS